MASQKSVPFIYKLYQLFRILSTLVYFSLVMRWMVLFPLVGTKFLPGGIHEYLCYSMVLCSIGEFLLSLKFHGFIGGLCSATSLKDFKFLYFVFVMHYYDDYEFAQVLKSAAYSAFILGLGFSQAYCHWCNLFKGIKRRKFGIVWKFMTYLMLPLLYISEFYLLLLNVQNPSFHSTPLLDLFNKVVLVLFLPVALSFYRNQHF